MRDRILEAFQVAIVALVLAFTFFIMSTAIARLSKPCICNAADVSIKPQLDEKFQAHQGVMDGVKYKNIMGDVY